MRFSLYFAPVALALASSVAASAQQAAAPKSAPAAVATSSAQSVPPADNPVADPKAVVTLGNARFTVLTPQLIRMEWSADGKFEDHSSFVFLNRRMPVPKFESEVTKGGGNQVLSLKTDALTLTYTPSGDGHFTADTLSIEITVDGKQVIWHPGDTDPKTLKAPRAPSTARAATRPKSRSARVSYRVRDGRWSMTLRARSSTPATFVFSRAKRARGRG